MSTSTKERRLFGTGNLFANLAYADANTIVPSPADQPDESRNDQTQPHPPQPSMRGLHLYSPRQQKNIIKYQALEYNERREARKLVCSAVAKQVWRMPIPTN